MIVRILLLGLFAISPLVAEGQITLTAGTFPAIGDTLRISVDNLPPPVSFVRRGGPQSWDLRELEAPYARHTAIASVREGEWAYLFPAASMLARSTDGGEAYYQRTGTALRILGRVGYDPLGLGIRGISYFKPARPDQRSPLRFQDQARTSFVERFVFATDEMPPGFFDSLLITPDSLRICIRTDRSEVVDAFGTLLLEDEDYEVLRISRTDIQQITLEARLPFGDWQEITRMLPPNAYFGNKTERSIHFLSNRSREAPAILYLDDRGQKVERIAFKAPLDLRLSNPVLPVGQPGVLAYPNPAIETVRFDFFQVPPGTYKLVLFNILGLPVWEHSVSVSGNQTLKVNFTDLKKGTYLYSLIDEGGKTLSTRRLMIIRP